MLELCECEEVVVSSLSVVWGVDDISTEVPVELCVLVGVVMELVLSIDWLEVEFDVTMEELMCIDEDDSVNFEVVAERSSLEEFLGVWEVVTVAEGMACEVLVSDCGAVRVSDSLGLL